MSKLRATQCQGQIKIEVNILSAVNVVMSYADGTFLTKTHSCLYFMVKNMQRQLNMK